jgi:hypothetical protein
MLLDRNIIIYAARPEHAARRTLIAEHGLETEEPERQFGGSHMPGAELDAVQSAALDTPHRFPFCAQNGGTHAR